LWAGVPTPPPFAVKFRVKILESPDGIDVLLRRMNSEGLAVGWSALTRACIYDSTTGSVCWEVTQLLGPDDLLRVPTGAVFSTCGVSSEGKIVGTMWTPDRSVGWAYVLEPDPESGNPFQGNCPSLSLIDDHVLEFACQTRGVGVNDADEALVAYRMTPSDPWRLAVCQVHDPGGYQLLQDYTVAVGTDSWWSDPNSLPQINIQGQVVAKLTTGGVFRYTPTSLSPIELFPELDAQVENVTGLNTQGVFCGRIYQPVNKNSAVLRPYRCYDTSDTDAPVPLEAVQQPYWSYVRINSSCDLLVYDDQIYHEGSGYLFNVESLVDTSDLTSHDLAIWDVREPLALYDLTDRYPIEVPHTVGRLCGDLKYYTKSGKTRISHSVGVVLTPEYPPAN
jgi:hypothetical protein